MPDPSFDPFGGSMKFLPTLAAFAGAVLSLRSTNDIAPWARMVSVGSAFSISYFSSPHVARILGWHEGDGLVFVALCMALFGIHFIGIVFKLLDHAKVDPFGIFGKLLDAWRGKSGGGA